VDKPTFVIVRDPRGSLVHVRKPDGECVGCKEVGLYEIVRSIVLAERGEARSDRFQPLTPVDAGLRKDNGAPR
jgi:hypothetical protein